MAAAHGTVAARSEDHVVHPADVRPSRGARPAQRRAGPNVLPPNGAPSSTLRSEEAHVGTFRPQGEPARKRDQRLPAAAHVQPGRLASLGRGGARQGARRGPAPPRLDRLQRLPLVPRDGARVLRGRGDGGPDEPPLREREGRPRGAPGRGPDLHGHRGAAHGTRRLAAHRLLHAGRPAVLRRHLLPAAACPRPPFVPPAPRGHRRRLADAPRRGGAERASRSWRRWASVRPASPRRRPGARRSSRRRSACCARRTASTEASATRPSFPTPTNLDLLLAACDVAAPATAAGRPRPRGPFVSRVCPPRPLRSARRRLPPLLRRRHVDDPALREDALRPGPAAAQLRRGVAPLGRRRRGAGLAHPRDGRLPAPRDEGARTAASSPARMPTARASRVASSSGPRTRSSACWERSGAPPSALRTT